MCRYMYIYKAPAKKEGTWQGSLLCLGMLCMQNLQGLWLSTTDGCGKSCMIRTLSYHSKYQTYIYMYVADHMHSIPINECTFYIHVYPSPSASSQTPQFFQCGETDERGHGDEATTPSIPIHQVYGRGCFSSNCTPLHRLYIDHQTSQRTHNNQPSTKSQGNWTTSGHIEIQSWSLSKLYSL